MSARKARRLPVRMAKETPKVVPVVRRNFLASQREIDRLIERAVWHESQAEAARYYAAALQVRLWT